MTDNQIEQSAWASMVIAILVAVFMLIGFCRAADPGTQVPLRLLPRHQVVDFIDTNGINTKIVIQKDLIDEVTYDL